MLAPALLSRILLFAACATCAGACGSAQQGTASEAAAEPSGRLAEVVPLRLALDGPAGLPASEISGLARCGDHYVLLPQLVSGEDAHLYVMTTAAVRAAVERGESIEPDAIPIEMASVRDAVRGFEGFESIVCDDAGRVHLTIEARRGLSQMQGYVVSGVGLEAGRVQLDTGTLIHLPEQSGLPNKSYEAAVIDLQGRLIAIYEANGIYVNPAPFVALVQPGDASVATRPIDRIEYRVTDATSVDADGRFWAMNYYFPGDMLLGDTVDDLAELYGSGATHAQFDQVERLVEFQLEEGRVTRVDRPPILLELEPSGEARNWEGVERFDERGFLIVTDLFPETILAFVPMPGVEVAE